MAKDIKDILEKSEPAEKPEVETKPEEKPEIVEDKPEAEVIAEPEGAEAEPAPQPESPSNKEVGGLKAAVTAERNKRQAAEAKIEQLLAENKRDNEQRDQRMMQLMQQFAPKPEAKPAPGIFDDPQAWEQHKDQSYDARLRNQDIKWSERLAVRHYGQEKFKEAESALAAHVRNNPRDPVVFAIQNSDDPAEVMMQWHQERTQLSSLQNPEGKVALLKEAIQDPAVKAMILEALGQEAQPKPAASQTPAPSTIPSNFAGARSVGVRGKAFTGPLPIAEVLNQRRK